MPLILIALGVGAAALVAFALRRASSASPTAAPTPNSLEEVTVTAQRIASKYPLFSNPSFDPSKYRGIRNNNPGNIEWIADPKKRWRGMIGQDGRYGVFDSADNGIRAIGGELKASIRKGQNTIEQIMTEWAPPSENPTAQVIDTVCRIVGVSARQVIDVYSYMPAIAQGIVLEENGVQPYRPSDIKLWVYS